MAVGDRHDGRGGGAGVLRHFLANEASGGIVLMAAAALALVVANSPLADAYFRGLHTPLGGLDLLHWINDGLMALFFLLVGLEVKREVLEGELSTWGARLAPGTAALGGMAVPALIYVAFNWSDPAALRGWAIPSATDIAFALGILSLLGSRVPASLKVFLAALAIIDDLGAVAIIAVFYGAGLDLSALAAAAAVLAALAVMNRMGVRRLWPYLLAGAALWVFVLRSGVHPTLAGVATAFAVPLRRPSEAPGEAASPLHRLEHGLHPWVAFLIVPVFGFANAGTQVLGVGGDALGGGVFLGVAAGLFVGKQLGVFLPVWALVRLGLTPLPAGAGWRQFYGVCVLCGVGFTMSLFIGLLAFPSEAAQAMVKLGVLAGSLASGLAGYLILRTLSGSGPPPGRDSRRRRNSASPPRSGRPAPS